VALNNVYIQGWGAISPAGWGTAALREAVGRGQPIPTTELDRPASARRLRVRSVPPPVPRPAFMAHARLRRSSAIAQFAVGAALEALGEDAIKSGGGSLRLAIVFCAMSGCVNFSRRFCDEMLADAATASPLLFPETVFNAPASHLAAVLGTNALYYTLVGDSGTFLQGLALAAGWLADERVDGCLVIGAEEKDWLVAEAFHFFDPEGVVGEGAGALYLSRDAHRNPAVELRAVTQPHLFSRNQSRRDAAVRARAELGGNPVNAVLCDGRQGVARLDGDETQAWNDWSGARLSPKLVCGDGLMAAAAWQCVTAAEALSQSGYSVANVSIVGNNQQAIAAQFVRATAPKPSL